MQGKISMLLAQMSHHSILVPLGNLPLFSGGVQRVLSTTEQQKTEDMKDHFPSICAMREGGWSVFITLEILQSQGEFITVD
jgi:hypothetical protein